MFTAVWSVPPRPPLASETVVAVTPPEPLPRAEPTPKESVPEITALMPESVTWFEIVTSSK